MPENIIADTSCLVLLEKIGELDILKKLYNTITITPTVKDEYGGFIPAFVSVKKVKNKNYQKLIGTRVDPGEASAIALAVEIHGLLVLDDLKARKLALELELDYTGTFGVLVDATQSGYIHSFANVLKRVKQTNFHLSEDLERRLLEMTGE